MKPNQYLVIMDNDNPALGFGKALHDSMYVSRSFKYVYEIAIKESHIENPRLGYRRALDLIRTNYGVTVKDKFSPQQFTIVIVRTL